MVAVPKACLAGATHMATLSDQSFGAPNAVTSRSKSMTVMTGSTIGQTCPSVLAVRSGGSDTRFKLRRDDDPSCDWLAGRGFQAASGDAPPRRSAIQPPTHSAAANSSAISVTSFPFSYAVSLNRSWTDLVPAGSATPMRL